MTKKGFLDWSVLSLRWALAGAAFCYFLFYLYAVRIRLFFPFLLEWVEGLSVETVMRVLAGQKIYVSPSLEFIPAVYTPLYFYISALVSKVIGVGFVPLRLVSFASTLGSLFVIFRTVEKETRSRWAAILAMGLFATSFVVLEGRFDWARVDSLAVFLMLLSLYFLRFSVSGKGYFLSGIFLVLSFLAKQTALMVSVPLMLYCLLTGKRAPLFFIGTFLVALLLSTWVLNVAHDGWYFYYCIDLPMQIELVPRFFLHFFRIDFLRPYGIACAISLFFLFVSWLQDPKEKWAFYVLGALGVIGASCLSRNRVGGYLNVLQPAYAMISVLFGLGAHSLIQTISEVPRPLVQRSLQIGAYLFCLIQFVSKDVRPQALMIPPPLAYEEGRRLLKRLKETEGDIFTPNIGYLPLLAGKSMHASAWPISDIMRGREGPIKEKLVHELRSALREQRFSAVFLGASSIGLSLEEIKKRVNAGMDVMACDDYCFWWEKVDISAYYVPWRPRGNENRPGMDTSHCFGSAGCLYIPRQGVTDNP